MLDATEAIDHWKAHQLSLDPILFQPTSPWEQDLYQTKTQDHGLDEALDVAVDRARVYPALESGAAVQARHRRSATSIAPSARCSVTR